MPGEKIKLLIVDDSFFIRTILKDIIHQTHDIEIIAEAKDGREAVLMAKKFRPDVITMDYNMPEMNGAEAVKEIISEMSDHAPALIMISANTTEGAQITLECLNNGAIDFLPKPSGEVSLNIDKVSEEIINKIYLAAEAHIANSHGVRSYKIKEKPRFTHAAEVVIIGSSTGGPPALEAIIKRLPAEMRVPLLVVQHMPKEFTRTLSERLDGLAEIEVKEAADGDEIIPGRCLIAPGGWHMKLFRDEASNAKRVRLDKSEEVNNFRPSIDVTMKSAIDIFGANILGVVLTGMGSDGSKGMLAIKEAGGYTIVQAPETAVISSMPQSVIDLDSADEILDLEKIANKLSLL